MTNKRKILVIDDDQIFLRRTKKNIKKFDVETTTTVSGAINVINKGGISFIVVDIKLRGGARGYAIFSKLFFKGTAVPGILITGHQLTKTEKTYLASLGALEILQKGGGTGSMSSRIEQSAIKILKNRNSKFIAITRRIEGYKLENKNMMYREKTMPIHKVIAHLKRSHLPIEEEDLVIRDISLICNAHLKHEDHSDYIFPQI